MYLAGAPFYSLALVTLTNQIRTGVVVVVVVVVPMCLGAFSTCVEREGARSASGTNPLFPSKVPEKWIHPHFLTFSENTCTPNAR